MVVSENAPVTGLDGFLHNPDYITRGKTRAKGLAQGTRRSLDGGQPGRTDKSEALPLIFLAKTSAELFPFGRRFHSRRIPTPLFPQLEYPAKRSGGRGRGGRLPERLPRI